MPTLGHTFVRWLGFAMLGVLYGLAAQTTREAAFLLAGALIGVLAGVLFESKLKREQQ